MDCYKKEFYETRVDNFVRLDKRIHRNTGVWHSLSALTTAHSINGNIVLVLTFILYTTKTTYICLQLYVIVEVLLISCLSNYMKPFMIADLTVFSSVFFNGKLIIMVNDCIDRATKIQIKIHLLMVCNLLKTIN